MNNGDVIAVDLPFRQGPRFYRVDDIMMAAGDVTLTLKLDGPFFDVECKKRDYNDASTAPKFHPDSFALKADVKDAT